MKLFIPALFFAFFLLAGCCGQISGPASSSCPYGTYGESCTAFCEKSKGTEFYSGPNCFSECIDLVKQQGFGDSTTCCKENIRTACERTCKQEISRIQKEHGSEVSEEELSDMISECTAECLAPYESIGMSVDSYCNLIDASLVH